MSDTDPALRALLPVHDHYKGHTEDESNATCDHCGAIVAALAAAEAAPLDVDDYPGRAEFAAGHNPYRCCSFHFAEATR